MQVLVTGAAGYIGTNLTNYLLVKGHKVIKVDKLYGTPAERTEVSEIDAIVHLAAMPGIQNCEKNKFMAVNDNVVSAEHIFRLGYDYNIPVVFSSSQAAKEPDSTYGLLKSVCEQMAIRLNVNVLRLANVYGGERYLETKTTVISNFINAKLKGLPITINGDGEQTRDFIHVEEVCRAIELCLDKKKVFVDIGTGIPRSMNTLAKMLQCDDIIYNSTSDSVGVSSNVAEISAATYMLGFTADDKLLNYLLSFINSS